MMHEKLSQITRSSVQEGLIVLDTATTVIRKNSGLQNSHNLATVSNISKHLSILLYYDKMINKQTDTNDINVVIEQVEASLNHIHAAIMDLGISCL